MFRHTPARCAIAANDAPAKASVAKVQAIFECIAIPRLSIFCVTSFACGVARRPKPEPLRERTRSERFSVVAPMLQLQPLSLPPPATSLSISETSLARARPARSELTARWSAEGLEAAGGGQPWESFHALSWALIRSVLSTRTMLAPTVGNSSILSAKGIWLEKPGHVAQGVSATWRPSGILMPLEPVQVTRLTPEPEIRTLGSPSCSMNSGSSVISYGRDGREESRQIWPAREERIGVASGLDDARRERGGELRGVPLLGIDLDAPQQPARRARRPSSCKNAPRGCR